MTNFLVESEPDAAYKDTQAYIDAARERRTAMAADAMVKAYGPQAADPTLWQGAVKGYVDQQTAPDQIQQSADKTTQDNLTTGQAQRADNQQQSMAVLSAAVRMSQAGMDGPTIVKNLGPHLAELGVDELHYAPLAQMIQQDPQGTFTKIYKGITGLDSPPAPLSPGAKMQGKVIYTTGADGAQHAGYVGEDGQWHPINTPAGTSFIADPDTTLTNQTKVNVAGINSGTNAAGGSTAMPSEQTRALILAAAKKYGVDPKLAFAVANQESGFDNTKIGGKGEVGTFQIMGPTAKALGVDPTDPTQNVDGGVRLLGQLLQKHGGNVHDALTEYNGGEHPNTSMTEPYVNSVRAYMSGSNVSNAMNPSDAIRGAVPGPLSLEAAAQNADIFNKTHQMPPLGMGGARGAAARMQVLNTAAARAAFAGKSGDDLASAQQQFNKEGGKLFTELASSQPNTSGGQIVGLGTLIQHIHMLSGAAAAEATGNVRALETIKQFWQTQTGSPLPTNLGLMKTTALAEYDRVASGNPSVAGRTDLRSSLSNASSLAQFAGAGESMTDFASARLSSQRARYTGAGPAYEAAFNAALQPAVRDVLNRYDAKNGMGAATPAQASAGPTPKGRVIQWTPQGGFSGG